MEDFNVPNGWQALVLTVIGAAVLKFVEWFLNRTKQKADEQTIYRQELRSDLETLKRQIQDMQNQIDGWREKYYQARDELGTVKAALEISEHDDKHLDSGK